MQVQSFTWKRNELYFVDPKPVEYSNEIKNDWISKINHSVKFEAKTKNIPNFKSNENDELACLKNQRSIWFCLWAIKSSI